MGLHVFWPATAALTMFVVGVIMILLKWGPEICGKYQQRLTRRYNNEEQQGYAREVSVSTA
jgi:hypothetical protein